MAKNIKASSTSTSTSRVQISQISSHDPAKVSRYYHEAMQEATRMVKAAEAQRKASQR
jgi:hypothetical protein